jgi:hypothetical protein
MKEKKKGKKEKYLTPKKKKCKRHGKEKSRTLWWEAICGFFVYPGLTPKPEDLFLPISPNRPYRFPLHLPHRIQESTPIEEGRSCLSSLNCRENRRAFTVDDEVNLFKDFLRIKTMHPTPDLKGCTAWLRAQAVQSTDGARVPDGRLGIRGLNLGNSSSVSIAPSLGYPSFLPGAFRNCHCC